MAAAHALNEQLLLALGVQPGPAFTAPPAPLQLRDSTTPLITPQTSADLPQAKSSRLAATSLSSALLADPSRAAPATRRASAPYAAERGPTAAAVAAALAGKAPGTPPPRTSPSHPTTPHTPSLAARVNRAGTGGARRISWLGALLGWGASVEPAAPAQPAGSFLHAPPLSPSQLSLSEPSAAAPGPLRRRSEASASAASAAPREPMSPGTVRWAQPCSPASPRHSGLGAQLPSRGTPPMPTAEPFPPSTSTTAATPRPSSRPASTTAPGETDARLPSPPGRSGSFSSLPASAQWPGLAEWGPWSRHSSGATPPWGAPDEQLGEEELRLLAAAAAAAAATAAAWPARAARGTGADLAPPPVAEAVASPPLGAYVVSRHAGASPHRSWGVPAAPGSPARPSTPPSPAAAAAAASLDADQVLTLGMPPPSAPPRGRCSTPTSPGSPAARVEPGTLPASRLGPVARRHSALGLPDPAAAAAAVDAPRRAKAQSTSGWLKDDGTAAAAAPRAWQSPPWSPPQPVARSASASVGGALPGPRGLSVAVAGGAIPEADEADEPDAGDASRVLAARLRTASDLAPRADGAVGRPGEGSRAGAGGAAAGRGWPGGAREMRERLAGLLRGRASPTGSREEPRSGGSGPPGSPARRVGGWRSGSQVGEAPALAYNAAYVPRRRGEGSPAEEAV
jgi:hypothetical protein